MDDAETLYAKRLKPGNLPYGILCLVNGTEIAIPEKACRFEGCPCLCHENPLTFRHAQGHAYQQKPGKADDGSFYEYCGLCGFGPGDHR